MSRPTPDLILEWCTVRGRGTREEFQRATDDLAPGEANRLLSALEISGHLEVDWEQTGRWSVNPPVLALPEGSGGNAVWIGGRNIASHRQLLELESTGAITSLTVIPQDAPYPSAWFVGIGSLHQLQAAADAVGAAPAIDPSARLVEDLLDLDSILRTRRSEYAPSGFRASQLNAQTLRYEPVDVKYAQWPPGCFEQMSRGRRRYIYVDDDNARHVCDRWVATHAELRRHRSAGRQVPTVLRWDKESERMAVDARAQLPTQWARAATLCTGTAPRRIKLQHGTWTDVYEGVRARIYGRFCHALGIPPVSTDLSQYDMEAP